MMSKLFLAVFAIVATLSQAFVPAPNAWTGRVSSARIARAAPLKMSAAEYAALQLTGHSPHSTGPDMCRIMVELAGFSTRALPSRDRRPCF